MRFRLLGFPVEVTNAVWILAGIYLLFGLQAQQPIHEIALWCGVVFFSILVHEMGHAAAALWLGMGRSRIVLHGFGGLTVPERGGLPWQHLVLSLAGPAAGLVLGCLALLCMLMPVPDAVYSGLVVPMIWVNIVWSLFNLLPLFPLDGGQALLSLLAIFAPKSALPVVHGLGLAGGLALGVAALFYGYIFILFVAGTVVSHNFRQFRRWQARRAR